MTDALMDTQGQIKACVRRIEGHLASANQEFKILRGLVEELPPVTPPRPPFWVRWYNWVALNLVNQLPLPR